MESLIRRRMQSLKKLTDNGKKTISIIQLQGYVQDVSFKFEESANVVELARLKNLNLPTDYIEFLSISNGMFLFYTEISGFPMGYASEVYSIDKVIAERKALPKSFNNMSPIMHIRDVGDMYINEEQCRLGKPYLTYPGMQASQCFDLSFSRWLDRYMVAGGNEFWNF